MNVFITGANRGIGLEFVKQYLLKKYHIIATCRDPDNAKELKQLESNNSSLLQIYKLNVTDEHSILYLVKKLKNTPIDILINNAGIFPESEEFGGINTDIMINTFVTNAIAPIKICEHFYPNVALSSKKTIVTISSTAGSIEYKNTGGRYAYRASKAALNMIIKIASIDLKKYDINVILLHPGWVRTDMGTDKAPLSVSKSVEGMIKVIYQKKDNSLCFYDWQGNILPW